MLALAVIAIAVVCGLVGRSVVSTQRDCRRDVQILSLLSTFGSVRQHSRSDPRALLDWHAAAESARRLFPDAVAALDAEGARFPFGTAEIEAAHTNWTAAWLAWEQDHDAEYQRRAGEIDTDLHGATDESARAARNALARLESEKLERYQRRYQEYVHVSKALAALTGAANQSHGPPNAPRSQ